jgi:hypothetical protein
MLCLSYYLLRFLKLEKRVEQVLPEWEEEEVGQQGAGRRDGLNNVYIE